MRPLPSISGSSGASRFGGALNFGAMFPVWEIDMEDGAAATGVFKAHLAAEPRDDLLHDTESEAGAALLPCVRGVGLRKLLEDPGLEVVRNATASVPHGYTDGPLSPFDRDHHFSAPRREFDRVREEVGDDLDQPIGVGGHLENARGSVELDPHPVALGESTIGFDRLLHERPYLDSLQDEDDVAGLDLLDVEDVVDEPDEPLAVGVGDGEQMRGGIGQLAGHVADEEGKGAHD